MTNQYVNKCKLIGKVAKFSDGWYDRKAQYDKDNKLFHEFLYTLIAGIIVGVLLSAFPIFVLGVTGKVLGGCIGFGISGIVLILVGGIGALVSAKDEPTPNATEFKCV